MAPILQLPDRQRLVAGFIRHAKSSDPLRRCLNALSTGTFRHPDGRTDELGEVRLGYGQLGLLAHLCEVCPCELSIEIGFGMGSSAAAILGTRTLLGKPFEHLIFDPYGVTHGGGAIVQEYLQATFGNAFKRIKERSDIGLSEIQRNRGPGCAGLIFIDGSHLYECVMADFALADRLCCEGGHIVFDDACFPAIETTVRYIQANRPDYVVSYLPVENTAVAKKIGPDKRTPLVFKPFHVPNRSDWEPITNAQ